MACPSCDRYTTETRNILFTLLMIAIFIVAVLGNSFAIIVISLSKRLQSQASNIFIASLAVTDLGVALFILPIRINSYIHSQSFCFNIHVCRMFNATDLIFSIGSVTHLFVIAIERFLAIKHPFFYNRVINTRLTIVCIVLAWQYAFIWAGLGMFKWEYPREKNIFITEAAQDLFLCLNDNRLYFTVVYPVVYIIPLLTMGVLYAVILKVVMKQARAIASLQPDNAKDGSTKNVKRRSAEIRATKTLAVVYGAFLVCWLPVTIIAMTSYWCKTCFGKLRENNLATFKFVMILFTEILPPVNSCLNPFIYILFNKQFRLYSKNVFWRILRQQQQINHSDESPSLHNQLAKGRTSKTAKRYMMGTLELGEQDAANKCEVQC